MLRKLAHPAAPYVFLVLGQLMFLGGVKDDAYIELRYAANLAAGHGLVFNVGDPPVEGSTSFAFPVLLSLAARLGLNLLVVAKLIGAASAVGIVWLVMRWVRRRGGDEDAVVIGGWLAATNASIAYWGQSAMEMVPAAFLAVLGISELERRDNRGLVVGLLALAGAATMRPEGHLLLGLAGLVACARAVRGQARGAVLGLVLAGLVVGTMHWVRWRQYGSLIPNTALVKAATFELLAGLRFLGQLGITGLFGIVIVLAVAEAARRRDDTALLVGVALLAFAAYFVRVGADEMALCRLYLPVAPLAIGLAALSLARLRRWIGVALTLAICGTGIGFSIGHVHFAASYGRGSQCESKIAAVLRERGARGDLVVDQDLGRVSYEALALRFVDPIGLVDRPIAQILYAEHANPFVRLPSRAAQAKIRARIFAMAPRFIVLVAYVDGPEHVEIERRFDAGESTRGILDEHLADNELSAGIFGDPRFQAGFRFVDAWKRNPTYYVALYERRAPDLDDP